MMSRLALVAVSLVGISSPLLCDASQQQQERDLSSHPRSIHFHTHFIDTRRIAHVLNKHYQDNRKQQFLIQLEDGQYHIKQQVEKHLGHSLVHYYPSNAWLTYITPETARTVASVAGVAWVGSYEPSYKLHSSIIRDDYGITPSIPIDPISKYFMNNTYDDDEIQQVWYNRDDEFAINVHLQEDSDLSENDIQSSLESLAQEWISTMNIEGNVEIHGSQMITIRLTSKASIRPLSDHIAHHPRVHYIERSSPITLHNRWAKSLSMWNLPAPTAASTMASAGLTGAGEVIGVIDTGLDQNSCFFYDEKQPTVPVTRHVRTANPAVQPSNHRKIIQFVQFNDDVNLVDDNGHGTHVAGIIAGQSTVSGFQPYNGMAPAAKLAVFDGIAAGRFVLPRPLDQFLFPYPAAVGAALHVNTWGSTNPAYESAAREFDTYMWNNPEFLAVISAGNTGDGGIFSPATVKNGIVVGSTVTSREAYNAIFCPPGNNNVGGGIDQNSQLCTEGKTTITPNAVADFSARGLTQDGRIKPDIVATGMFLASAKNGQAPGKSCTSAPSDVLKARAGTSMSAGVVAGDIALLRQYFRGGFYPSGTPVNPPIQPSAALLKAIVIDGAVPSAQIQGQGAPTQRQHGFGRMVVANGVPLWGSTFSLLMKRNVTNDNPLGDPFFTADVNPAKTPHDFVFCASPITQQRPTRLTVTLVWTDAPGTVNSRDVLVNDLDLQVVNGATRATLLGNGNARDTKNNVEQVIVNQLNTATTFTARVVPNRVTVFNNKGQQPYALVVTGNVEEGECGATRAPTRPPTPPTGTTSGPVIPTVAPGTPEFFTWLASEFSTCTKPCADADNPQGGFQTRTVSCLSSVNGVVPDAPCVAAIATIGPKPCTIQACNTRACGQTQYEWKIGTFTTCSARCADLANPQGGTQTRTVTCQTIAQGNTQSVPVDPKFCADHTKPVTIQACNTLPCATSAPGGGNNGIDGIFEWRTSPPSACSVTCGGGVALRQVTCNVGEIPVPESFCAGLPKPSTSIPCNTQPCAPGQDPRPAGTQAPATDPLATGPGGNTTMDNPMGGVPPPPSLTGNLPAPVAQTFQWQVYDYGPCSVGCADEKNPTGGIQTRVVKCRSSLGNFDDDGQCASVPKPPVSKTCNMDRCPTKDDFNLEWVTGVYGICDVDTRVQTRWVVCKTTNNQYVDFAQCQAHVGPLPTTTQPCTPGPDALNEWQTKFGTPVWSWQAQRFGDCSQWCNGPGTQTRGLHCLAPMGLVANTFDQCRGDSSAGPEPTTSQQCGAGACASSPQWYGGDFIGCSDPDPCLGTERRHVFCIDTNGKKTDTTACTEPQISTERSPCGACVPKAKTILGLSPGAIVGIAAGVGISAMCGVGYLVLQWRRRITDQNNKVASRIALSKV